MPSLTTRRLGDICEIYQPKTISKKQMKEDGKYVVFGANGIIGRYDQYNHEAPELLITCRGATCGSVNFSEPKSWITGNAMVVRPIVEDLDRAFLSYFCRGILDFSKVITGAAQPQITRQSLAPVEIAYPSLPEQKRIVAILDEAFAAIDTAIANTGKNLANARELFESYLNQVLTEAMEKWPVSELSKVVAESCSLSYGIVQPGQEVAGGLPIVRPTDLKSKFIRLEGLKRIDPSLASAYQRTTLTGGELLICVRGSTGTISVASKELAGSNVTRGIVPIRFEASILNPEFAYYQLISKSFQGQVKAGTYGAALMQINIRDLRKVDIIVPPLDIQNILLRQFDALAGKTQSFEAAYRRKGSELVHLKQSILQKAFVGELTANSVEDALA